MHDPNLSHSHMCDTFEGTTPREKQQRSSRHRKDRGNVAVLSATCSARPAQTIAMDMRAVPVKE